MRLISIFIFLMMLFAITVFAQGRTNIPVVGHKFRFDFGDFAFMLHFENDTELAIYPIKDSKLGTEQIVMVNKTEIRPNVYMVTWQEKSGTTVTDIQDFERGIVYANITEPGNIFEHWKGKILPWIGRQ